MEAQTPIFTEFNSCKIYWVCLCALIPACHSEHVQSTFGSFGSQIKTLESYHALASDKIDVKEIVDLHVKTLKQFDIKWIVN